jgi:hypothetical protein
MKKMMLLDKDLSKSITLAYVYDPVNCLGENIGNVSEKDVMREDGSDFHSQVLYSTLNSHGVDFDAIILEASQRFGQVDAESTSSMHKAETTSSKRNDKSTTSTRKNETTSSKHDAEITSSKRKINESKYKEESDEEEENTKRKKKSDDSPDEEYKEESKVDSEEESNEGEMVYLFG